MYLDPQLIEMLIAQAKMEQAWPVVTMENVPLPQGGTAGQQAASMEAVVKSGLQTGIAKLPDMLKGVAASLAATLAYLKQSEFQAPASEVGFKYPIQVATPYQKRPLGFRPLLGGK